MSSAVPGRCRCCTKYVLLSVFFVFLSWSPTKIWSFHPPTHTLTGLFSKTFILNGLSNPGAAAVGVEEQGTGQAVSYILLYICMCIYVWMCVHVYYILYIVLYIIHCIIYYTLYCILCILCILLFFTYLRSPPYLQTHLRRDKNGDGNVLSPHAVFLGWAACTVFDFKVRTINIYCTIYVLWTIYILYIQC
jgi:hypothetical protein